MTFTASQAWLMTGLSSYFKNRVQSIIVNGDCGIPQGSVVGLLMFMLYSAPSKDIIRKHGLLHVSDADDTQTTHSFTCMSLLRHQIKTKVEKCIDDIHNWMACNRLKLNDSKTELLLTICQKCNRF